MSRSVSSGGGVAFLLWDIDGTLVQVSKSREDKHRVAVESVLRIRVARERSWDGRTDGEIVHALAQAAGRTLDDSQRRAVLVALELATERELGVVPALPARGATRALKSVALRGWRNGLLTGNTRARALAKLESAGLLADVDPQLGFYGAELLDRRALVGVALEKLRRKSPGARLIVLGDTPNDIEAATANGVECVAVATGVFSKTQLRDAGAAMVLEDLVVGLPRLLRFCEARADR